MVFEYCEHDLGRLLDTMPRPFTEGEVKCLMKQVIVYMQRTDLQNKELGIQSAALEPVLWLRINACEALIESERIADIAYRGFMTQLIDRKHRLPNSKHAKQRQLLFVVWLSTITFVQLLEAVEWLHSRSVMHRDLKLCNLLMTKNGHVKLCDFGLARYVSAYEENYTPGVVTLWYRYIASVWPNWDNLKFVRCSLTHTRRPIA